MRVPPSHPPADGHCHTALSPECPEAQERDRQTGRGLAPAPASPPGAPQGAAGDSSPSELSYVSFLLRWGLGVNQFLGAVSPGSAAVLSSGLGWGWSGARRGQGGSERTAMPSPPM